MSTFDDLCDELDKDPEFCTEYQWQILEHEALMACIKEKPCMQRRIREAIVGRAFTYAHQLLRRLHSYGGG